MAVRSVWHFGLPTAHRAALLLIVVTGLLYAQTYTFGFVHEDLNDPATWLQAWNPEPQPRWITGASFGLGYALSGVDPWGHHLVSMSLHLLNGALLWACLPGTGWAVFVLGLYLLHPMQVESVAYISARSDLLLAMVALLAVHCVNKGQVALGLLVAASGMAVKEAGIALLPLIGLWAWRTRQIHAATVTAIVATMALGVLPLSQYLAFDPLYTLREITKAWFYVTALVVPWPLSIEVPTWWSASTDGVAFGVFLLGLAVVAVVASLRAPRAWWAFSVLWVVIALSPRLLVPLVEGLHAHHFAVPLVGLALGLGALKESA